jgi:hypothetical protein
MFGLSGYLGQLLVNWLFNGDKMSRVDTQRYPDTSS